MHACIYAFVLGRGARLSYRPERLKGKDKILPFRKGGMRVLKGAVGWRFGGSGGFHDMGVSQHGVSQM